jgi:hypothetical protein
MSDSACCLRNRAMGVALLMATAASGLACGNASAMSRSPSTGPSSSGVAAGIIGPATLAAGSFDEGYQLGLRNGGILVARLKQRTTDLQGCDAIDQLQDALVRVSATIRPPASSSSQLVAGFLSGYLDSIRDTLAEVRNSCGQGQYSSGDFAGSLYGAVACQAKSVSLDALSSLQLKPLYSGWSGGSESVQLSCRTSLKATIQSCSAGADLGTTLEAAIQLSCSDSVSSE